LLRNLTSVIGCAWRRRCWRNLVPDTFPQHICDRLDSFFEFAVSLPLAQSQLLGNRWHEETIEVVVVQNRVRARRIRRSIGGRAETFDAIEQEPTDALGAAHLIEIVFPIQHRSKRMVLQKGVVVQMCERTTD
jgi:hypothetical protein